MPRCSLSRSREPTAEWPVQSAAICVPPPFRALVSSTRAKLHLTANSRGIFYLFDSYATKFRLNQREIENR
jgi:hypothetical protein